MSLFALTLPHEMRAWLLFFVEMTFTLYVLLSFIVVARYTARKIAVGRLINGRASPLSPFTPPAGAWLFVFNIPALIFVQSALYVVVALTVIIIFLVVDKRLARDEYSVSRAGVWLFIVNIFALLFTRSPFYMALIVMSQAVLLLENGRTPQQQFGLERLTGAQLAKWSVLICGAVMVVAQPLMLLFQTVLNILHFSHPEQQSVEVFRQTNEPSQIADFLIQAVLLAPMIEELFFRGFLLTFLKNYMSTWIALVLSAGLFAVAHQNLDSVLPLWLVGIVLGVAYEHTGSILLPMGIHACFNLTNGLTLLAQR